jgi:DNA-binding Lrp family transcriptional regulator
MIKSLSETEKQVLRVIQHGMPRSKRPFADMAQEAGMETEDLLDVIKRWKSDGSLRRIGAIVSHFEVGLPSGMMVVWQVESGRIEEVGKKLAGFPEVSHAYERITTQNWPYNLYTMVHGSSTEEVEKTVEAMSKACGVENYRGLITEKELKKVPPTYIVDK